MNLSCATLKDYSEIKVSIYVYLQFKSEFKENDPASKSLYIALIQSIQQPHVTDVRLQSRLRHADTKRAHAVFCARLKPVVHQCGGGRGEHAVGRVTAERERHGACRFRPDNCLTLGPYEVCWTVAYGRAVGCYGEEEEKDADLFYLFTEMRFYSRKQAIFKASERSEL